MRQRRRFPLLGLALLLTTVVAACELPSIDDYDPLPLAQTSFLYAADGSLITELHAAFPGLELLAGGGVRDAGDLRALADAGAAGALVATALHRGVIGPRELR